jgi:HSP20 family protein
MALSNAFGWGSLWEWDPFRELERMQRGMDAVLGRANDSYAPGFPQIDVWANEDGAVVTAELPGIEPDRLDISVVGDTVTLSGSRSVDAPDEADKWVRRERGHGAFERSIRLPFQVDADAVAAQFKHGVLAVKLPIADVERPRRIEVQTH